MVSRRQQCSTDRRVTETAGISVLARWGHAEGGEGRELPASPDRGSG